MRITYRITTNELYNGRPMPRPRGEGRNGSRRNPVALAMDAVHGESAADVRYAGHELRAHVDGHTVRLPGELKEMLDAHAAGDAARARPCAFRVDYGTRPARATMLAGGPEGGPK